MSPGVAAVGEEQRSGAAVARLSVVGSVAAHAAVACGLWLVAARDGGARKVGRDCQRLGCHTVESLTGCGGLAAAVGSAAMEGQRGRFAADATGPRRASAGRH